MIQNVLFDNTDCSNSDQNNFSLCFLPISRVPQHYFEHCMHQLSQPVHGWVSFGQWPIRAGIVLACKSIEVLDCPKQEHLKKNAFLECTADSPTAECTS